LMPNASEEDMAKALAQLKKSGIDLHKLSMSEPANLPFPSDVPKPVHDSAMLPSQSIKIDPFRSESFQVPDAAALARLRRGTDQFRSESPHHSSDSAMLTQSSNFARGSIGPVGSPRESSSCFVATAVYGDSNSIHVQFLRAFRNEFLLKNVLGRSLVKFYYKVGPHLAKPVARRPFLKALTRKSLSRIIRSIERHTHLRLEDFGSGD
jgi:hypothetical protein